MRGRTSLPPGFPGKMGADVREAGGASGGRFGGHGLPAGRPMEPHLPSVPGCGALPRLPSREPGEQAEGQGLQDFILPQLLCRAFVSAQEPPPSCLSEAAWRGGGLGARLRRQLAGGPRGGGRRPWAQLQLAQGGPCTSVPSVPAHSVALFGKHKGPWYGLKPGQAWQPPPRHGRPLSQGALETDAGGLWGGERGEGG